MAKGDILDKLKIAGYVTSTDPSDAVETALDIHEGGDVPTGTIEITENGEGIDVSSYATANVNVPGVIPTGTINITENGEGIDVSSYATANVDVPTSGGTVDESSVAKFIQTSVYTYNIDPDTADSVFDNGALFDYTENSDPVIISSDFISDYETKVAEEKSAHTAAGDLDNYQLQDLTGSSGGAVQIQGDWYDVRIWDFQPDNTPDFILFGLTTATHSSQQYYFPYGSYLNRAAGEHIYCSVEEFIAPEIATFVHNEVNTIDKIMFIQGSADEIYPRIAQGQGVPALYYPSQEQPAGEDWLGQCKFVWVEITPQNP